MNRAMVAAVAVVVIVLAACSSAGTTSAPTRADTETPGLTYYAPGHRQPAPSISAATLAGSRVALADVLGHGVVVVNVWASWCVECRAESRGLGRLATSFRGRHVRFLGVDEQDVAAKARAFAAAAHVGYSQLVDPDGTVLTKLTMLPSDGIPSTLVIDSHGQIAGRIIGTADESRLRHLVERVAASG